jgi:hypothetical protein
MRQPVMEIYGVFAMSAAHHSKSMAAICAVTFALVTSPAYSQEAQPPRLPTIADCPPGYVLAVQDTADPMLPARQPDPNARYVQNNQEAIAAIQQQTEAPRQFVTGCVQPQIVQPVYGEQQ